MSRLKNAQRERFSVHMARGLNSFDAYKAAGYSNPSREKAQRLAMIPEVAMRIDELVEDREQSQVSQAFDVVNIAAEAGSYEDLGVSKMQLLALAKNLYDIAAEEADVKSGLKALEFIGKVTGAVRGPGRPSDDAEPVSLVAEKDNRTAQKQISNSLDKFDQKRGNADSIDDILDAEILDGSSDV